MDRRVQALVVELGCLMPQRTERLSEYARVIGVDEGLLCALFAGVGTEGALTEAEFIQAHTSGGADAIRCALEERRMANCGKSTWSRALRSAAAAFELVTGSPWDYDGYTRFLASGAGPALNLARSAALGAIACELPVVVVAPAPREMAVVTAALIDLPLPVQVTSDLGLCPPDRRVWEQALNAMGLGDAWDRALVTVESTDSAEALQAMTTGPREVWVLGHENEEDWIDRLRALRAH